ncbi:MAG TPA: hypothetical protein VLV85_06785 [Stellaceae bacterium]|nr:hypothetical protein [Stellaceae bacterium]
MAENSADPDLILDAISYVEEVHRAETAENTAPPPGTAGRVVAAILADAALSESVRRWARERRILEASTAPPVPPPIDDVYRRVSRWLKTAEAATP